MPVNNGNSDTLSKNNTIETSISNASQGIRTLEAIQSASKRELEINKRYAKELQEYKDRLAEESKKSAQQRDLEDARKLAEEAKKLNREAHRESGDVAAQIEDKMKDLQEHSAEITTKFINDIEASLDSVINRYLDTQLSISAHLVGTGYTIGEITDTLQNALSAQGLVKQERVYENLSKLISDGIVYNVEQRAFLQTLSDDMKLSFQANNAALTRLIRLQNLDLTENRLAIQYSLQEFLNSNYNTSEYIKNSFNNVSSLLLESQSLMTPSGSMEYEAAVQTWLGSLYSAGVSQESISGLASAINALGSGDISGLGSGISNLVMMGVARSGKDYGEFLNSGFNISDLNDVMNSINDYILNLGDSSSNVVKSELAKVFGLRLSDLAAINNLRETTGGATTDIDSLFSAFSSLVPGGVFARNLMDNATYTWGTNIASNPIEYWLYKGTQMIGNLLQGVAIQPFGISLDLGTVVKAAGLLPSLLETVVDSVSSLSNGVGGLEGLYNALSLSSRSGARLLSSEEGVSSSFYAGSGSSDEIFKSAKLSSLSMSESFASGDEESPTEKIKETTDLIYTEWGPMINSLSNDVNRLTTTVEIVSNVLGRIPMLSGGLV